MPKKYTKVVPDLAKVVAQEVSGVEGALPEPVDNELAYILADIIEQHSRGEELRITKEKN